MKEDLNNNTCKVLTNTTICKKDHTFFMSLLRRRSMMKIKVPKLILKTMRVTKDRGTDNDDDDGRSKKRDKSVFVNKFGSILNNVFKFKKGRRSGASSNSSGNGLRVHDNQAQCSSDSSLRDDDLSESSRPIDTSPESKKDDEGKKSIIAFEQVLKEKKDDDDQSFPRGLFADLSNSFGSRRRNSFKFIKGNMNKRTVSRRRRVENMIAKGSKKDGGADSGKRDDELCKKRILMGEKCRPLNLSGTLHYDKDGIILPEP